MRQFEKILIDSDFQIYRINRYPFQVMLSHADGLNMILVSNDQAFFQIQGLKVED